MIDDNSLFLLWSDRFYPVDFDDWSILHTRSSCRRPFGCSLRAAEGRVAAEGNRRVEIFETSEPIRAATILADTRWIETERTVGGRRLRTLLHPAAQELSEHILASSADVLDFYESRFGPYAFDEFTFATVEGIFARRAVAGGAIYSPAYLDREMRSTGHDAHETALLWWFYTVAGRGPGSFQWIEGFGDYAEVLYDEARGRPIPPIFESFRLGYLGMAGMPEEPSITEPNRGPRWGNYVHGRLPWLMHLLRFAAGRVAFDRGLRLLFERWRFKSFTLEEFVSTLAEGTGEPLDWWRSEWLERGGVPELTWRSVVHPERDGFQVSLTVWQTGALYHLPLEIGIETDQGLRLERVRLDEPLVEFQFFSPAEPRRVLVDPRRWLLAKITSE